MSFAEAIERQQAAIFDRLGEDATWSGVTGAVRVMRRERDEEEPFGDSRAVLRTNFIKVRRSQVMEPAAGDTATVDAGSFTVVGQPLLNRRGVWTCQVVEAA